MENNPVGWFEIPVHDIDRAKTFYETVFKTEIKIQDMGGVTMGFFMGDPSLPGAMGSLIKHETYIPSKEGALIYFQVNDLQDELDRVAGAGGSIYKEKSLISPETGYMGVFLDTEGNRIALYSKP